MTTNPETLVRAWTDALNRGDAHAAASFFCEDGVFHDTGTGQRCEGRAACAQYWSSGPFTDLKIVKTTFLTAGTAFATEWVMTGVHGNDAPGLPASGRSFRLVGAGVGEIRDGRILRVTEYWNMAEFLTQVGFLPAPSTASSTAH